MLSDDGHVVRAPRHAVPLDVRLELYRHMRRLRRLDARLSALQRQGRIGFYGAALGQEAVPVAAALAAAPDDWIFPALREGAVLLVRGLPLVTYLAQLFGSARDPLKGRQMPNHVASRSVNVVSWSSCIGTQLPHAVGAALAAAKLGSNAVVLAFLGDGATSHPDFHAALNFAGVFRAPVVFVCQNNQYAISLPSTRQTASSTFAEKARAYGLTEARIDGNDAIAVYAGIADALDRARGGGGATLIECVTYRLGAHSSSDDPSLYRSAAEEASWRERDPIRRLGRHLEREGVGSAARDREIDAALDAELERALAEVEQDPRPALETLFDDVYARVPWHLVEQRAELRRVAGSRPEHRSV